MLQYTHGKDEPWDGTPAHNCFIIVADNTKIFDYAGNGVRGQGMEMGRTGIVSWLNPSEDWQYLSNFKITIEY
jgi:hypothetical protein